MYQPDARGSQASIPRIPCPVPSTISSRNHQRILVLVNPSPSPVFNPVLLALSSSLVMASRSDVGTSGRPHTRLMSLLLSSSRRGGSFSPPSTLPVILFLSFSRLPIYLSIYPSIRVSSLFAIYPSIRLPIYPRSRLPLVLWLFFLSLSLWLQCWSVSPCANVSKSVYDITTCSPATCYFLSRVLTPG